MRFLVSSDWHVDAITAGVERLPELAEYVSALETAIHEHEVDTVLNLGDLWDPGSIQDARWATFVYESFLHLGAATRVGRTSSMSCGLVAIPGNHDVIDTSSPMSTLSPLRVTDPRCVRVLEAPTVLELGQVAYLALPYVSRAYERTDDYRRALGEAFERAHKLRNGGFSIVVGGHLSFDGMHPGSESTDMAHGREVPFPVQLVEELRPALVVNGHYHARQTIRRGELDIEIPGAPITFTFGEAKDGGHGFLIVEV